MRQPQMSRQQVGPREGQVSEQQVRMLFMGGSAAPVWAWPAAADQGSHPAYILYPYQHCEDEIRAPL